MAAMIASTRLAKLRQAQKHDCINSWLFISFLSFDHHRDPLVPPSILHYNPRTYMSDGRHAHPRSLVTLTAEDYLTMRRLRNRKSGEIAVRH